MASKPGLHPESPKSPRNPTRQQIFPRKGEGGIAQRILRCKSVFPFLLGLREFSKRRFPSVESRAVPELAPALETKSDASDRLMDPVAGFSHTDSRGTLSLYQSDPMVSCQGILIPPRLSES